MVDEITKCRFLVRGGPTASAQSDVPLARELLLDTTTRELHVGDGSTPGGLPLTVGTPTDARHPANKEYVDTGLAARSLKTHQHTTDDIPEGSQLYFSASRADGRIAVQKGKAEGLATLDTGGKIPASQLPDSIVGQVVYKGTWNAGMNTPFLPPAEYSKGFYYVVAGAGKFGGVEFDNGDWCISDGTQWAKVDNSDAVTTVFGRNGNIVANASDYADFYPSKEELDEKVANCAPIVNGLIQWHNLPSMVTGYSVSGAVTTIALPDGLTVSTIAAITTLHL